MHNEPRAILFTAPRSHVLCAAVGVSTGIVASAAAISLGCAPVAGLLLIALGVGQTVTHPAP